MTAKSVTEANTHTHARTHAHMHPTEDARTRFLLNYQLSIRPYLGTSNIYLQLESNYYFANLTIFKNINLNLANFMFIWKHFDGEVLVLRSK